MRTWKAEDWQDFESELYGIRCAGFKLVQDFRPVEDARYVVGGIQWYRLGWTWCKVDHNKHTLTYCGPLERLAARMFWSTEDIELQKRNGVW